MASALGQQACMLGYRVLYANTPKIFAKLKMAKADASYIKEITKIERLWYTTLRCTKPTITYGNY
ncbi:ATP-binding protein [Segetibacter koreensis]|uniref:ATP-binding protein n=1 Tax=Segetibacter koreensis TaxID=398037 RepID=UPI003CCC3C14